MDYKAMFIDAYTKNIKRAGADKLLESLTKSDFFIAPASTVYHENYEGGLCEHSVKVWKALEAEVDAMHIPTSVETIAICGLLHDLCKVGYYAVEMRNRKNDKGQWVQVPVYTVQDRFPFGHGEKSVFLIQNHMELTPEEAQAIRFHMGAYEGQHIWKTLGMAYEANPLALATHIADMKATYLKIS